MKMKRTGTTLLAAMAILTVLDMSQGAAQAQASWSCTPGGPAAIDSNTARELSHNPTMTRVLQEYRARWDAAYIREQCDAAASGDNAEIGCLQGRRDWDAIQAMIPENLRDGTRDDLRPHLRELQGEDDGIRAAYVHCRDLGVIK